MNVEIEAEAVLFPEKEYINGIVIPVHLLCVPSKWRHCVSYLDVVTVFDVLTILSLASQLHLVYI